LKGFPASGDWFERGARRGSYTKRHHYAEVPKLLSAA